MNWQHYSRLIQAKSTSTAAWQTADSANAGNSLDMLALAIHESKAHDVAGLIQRLMNEVSNLRQGIQRCDYCGEIMEHFSEKHFEGYLCPNCDAGRITELRSSSVKQWTFERAALRHIQTLTER